MHVSVYIRDVQGSSTLGGSGGVLPQNSEIFARGGGKFL